MNSRQHQHIIRLIARYYDGLTDIDEERELVRYFSETPVSEIPRELLEERRFFIALYDAPVVTEKETMRFPEDLGVRIEEAILNEARKERTAAGMRRRRLLAISGIAASLALLFGVAVGLLRPTAPLPDAPREKLAEASFSAHGDEAPSAEIPPHSSLLPPAEAESVPSRGAAPHSGVIPERRHTRPSPAAHPGPQEDIREVTDAREAEEILAKVDALIAANIASGASAFDSAGRMFGEEMEKVDKIKTMDI